MKIMQKYTRDRIGLPWRDTYVAYRKHPVEDVYPTLEGLKNTFGDPSVL